METYPIPMIPGPTAVPADVRAVFENVYGSSDMEPEFLELYNRTEGNLQLLFGTRSRVVIQTGEGMLALWSALKSCLRPGERVLCVGTGIFGYGIGDMARLAGAEVRTVGYGYDETIHDLHLIEGIIAEFKPRMITAVHCETPSGTLNPLKELGRLKEKHGVPLFYVDTVASLGGAPVNADSCHIDLCLGGSQKVLSAPANMSFVAVSPRAWKIIDAVDYAGYDALKPFAHAQEDFYFPYTPDWYGVAAVNAGAERIIAEGLENCWNRHAQAAEACRAGLTAAGYELYPRPAAVQSPTVTAVKVPAGITWPAFDALLRADGLAVGGNYGPLAGKVFRLGHMGSQAQPELVSRALEVLEQAIHKI